MRRRANTGPTPVSFTDDYPTPPTSPAKGENSPHNTKQELSPLIKPPSFRNNKSTWISSRFNCLKITRTKLVLIILFLFFWKSIIIIYSIVSQLTKRYGVYFSNSSSFLDSYDLIRMLSNSDFHKLVSPTTSYAVVINTYKRPDMLKLSIDHYAKTCGKEYGIDQIFIVWAELDVQPPSPETYLDPSPNNQKITNVRNKKKYSNNNNDNNNHHQNWPSLEFIRVPKDSLNSRFLPISNLKSDAVFMVDDDVRVECSSLMTAFDAWRFHPNALVGFYPRLATTLEKQYHTWPVVYLRQSFNIILTKACFFHRKYMDLYFDPNVNPIEVLDYVDKDFNCEDIAMAFLVANQTRTSLLDMDHGTNTKYCHDCPTFVEGSIKDLGLTNGISTSGSKIIGHMNKRSECIDAINQIYNAHGWDFPLVEQDLQRGSWVHYFPGYWWQAKPSNVYEWFSIGNLFSSPVKNKD